MARRVEIEFVSDRLADAWLAQAYVILAPERRRVTRKEESDSERQQRQRVGDGDGGRRVAAIYARVSSERQRRERTIGSQTAALRELAAARGLLVVEDLVFEDEGVSGTVLRRPGLERLRDLAVEGRFEVLLCHAPDRLARRYAYQVLLLEEFQRAGIEVIFAKEPERSGTPEDELLRQFQGMIAEYERAQIAERCRRGKLHRARAGAVSVMARAPYGYRYVKRSEHADAIFEIDEAEAPVVREIFRRYLEDDESIAKIARWLTGQGVPTRTRATGWNNATIWGMLRNPAYAGQAAYGKTRATGEVVRATRQARLRGRRSTHISREEVSPEEWKRIAVPALISEEQFALAQERLHRNSRFSPAIPVARRCCRAFSSVVSAGMPTTAVRPAARTGSCASTTAARAPTATAAPKDASARTVRSALRRSTSSSGPACSRCSKTPC